MDYKKIYIDLVKKRLLQPAKLYFDYTQNHHIKPVSIYPQEKKNKKNIVNLSAREHFIAHALLVKYYKQVNDKPNYYKMLNAFDAMSKLWGSNKSIELRYKCGNKKSYLYAVWKEQLSRYIKQSGCRAGINSSNYGKTLIHNDQLKTQKYINKDQEMPDGWKLGAGDWNICAGKDSYTYNRVWCYNIKTNKQFYLKKDKVEKLLQNNPDIKIGINPNSKVHVQQYNPLNDNIWISNLELKEFKLWPKEKEIPKGWLRGKVQDFDDYLFRYQHALKNEGFYFVNYNQELEHHKVPEIRMKHQLITKLKKQFNNSKQHFIIQKAIKQLVQKNKNLQKKIQQLHEYYKVYNELGFKGVVQKFNYQHTKQCLVQLFARYVPQFIPQNGKKRGN